MVQLTTSVERSFIENGEEVIEFRVPAVSRERARSNALFAARVKGMDDPDVEEVEETGGSGVPGRKLFLVTVTAIR